MVAIVAPEVVAVHRESARVTGAVLSPRMQLKSQPAQLRLQLLDLLLNERRQELDGCCIQFENWTDRYKDSKNGSKSHQTMV
jgi:hypothetical protein